MTIQVAYAKRYETDDWESYGYYGETWCYGTGATITAAQQAFVADWNTKAGASMVLADFEFVRNTKVSAESRDMGTEWETVAYPGEGFVKTTGATRAESEAAFPAHWNSTQGTSWPDDEFVFYLST